MTPGAAPIARMKQEGIRIKPLKFLYSNSGIQVIAGQQKAHR